MLKATFPNSPESSFNAFMYLFFVLPSAIFEANASKLDIFLYEKLMNSSEAMVATMNSESVTTSNEISELDDIIFENRIPIPIEIKTIKKVRNLYPMI